MFLFLLNSHWTDTNSMDCLWECDLNIRCRNNIVVESTKASLGQFTRCLFLTIIFWWRSSIGFLLSKWRKQKHFIFIDFVGHRQIWFSINIIFTPRLLLLIIVWNLVHLLLQWKRTENYTHKLNFIELTSFYFNRKRKKSEQLMHDWPPSTAIIIIIKLFRRKEKVSAKYLYKLLVLMIHWFVWSEVLVRQCYGSV